MKKPKIIFEEGCFDSMDDMTQEEMDEFIAQIEEMIDSGEFFENSIPVSELSEEEQEEIAQLFAKGKHTRQ